VCRDEVSRWTFVIWRLDVRFPSSIVRSGRKRRLELGCAVEIGSEGGDGEADGDGEGDEDFKVLVVRLAYASGWWAGGLGGERRGDEGDEECCARVHGGALDQGVSR